MALRWVLNVPACCAHNRRTVAEIRVKIIEKGGRNQLSQIAHAKDDKEELVAWKLDLNRILHVFNVSFVIPV